MEFRIPFLERQVQWTWRGLVTVLASSAVLLLALLAVLEVVSYPATAEVTQACTLWCLPRAALLELLRATPELGLAMLGSISLWTRKLLSKLELHTQRRVEERLAIYLLSRAGSRELEPGDRIELAEPRNLIAAQCGTAPEVLSRTFRRLEEEGVLVAAPHHVTITDPGKLAALAELIE